MADQSPTGIALSVASPKHEQLSWRPFKMLGVAGVLLVVGLGLGIWSHAKSADAGTTAEAYPAADSGEPQPIDLTNGAPDSKPPTGAAPAPNPPPPEPPPAQNNGTVPDLSKTDPKLTWLSAGGTANANAEQVDKPKTPTQLAWESEYKAQHTPLVAQGAGTMPEAPWPETSGAPVVQPAPPHEQQQPAQQTQQAQDGMYEPLATVRRPQAARYALPAGTWIHAKLDERVISDLGGDLRAVIDQTVRDDAQNVLIPQWTVILGSTSNRLTLSDHRLLQIWSMLVFPDRSVMRLNELTGNDDTGAAGVKDHVNQHIGTLIRNAAIFTAFSAGIAVTQRGNYSLLAAPSVGATIGQSVGQSLGELGSQVMQRDLAREATAELRPGTGFYVRLNRELDFTDGPYAPMRPQDHP